MDITNTYRIKIENTERFVYEGTCDGIPTKWVTQSKWDYKITIQMIKGQLKYKDSDGNEILVYDEDDVEYKHIRK